MLYVIPIEPLEERYSKQWLEWTLRYLGKIRMPCYRIINPSNVAYTKIEQGAFLDVIGTNRYKNRQMEYILDAFNRGDVRDGDIFWFHDMWFPGLEMLAYIRDALGIKIKIYGMLHAGTYDPHDYLTKKGMAPWGFPLEESWIEIVDGIFVATYFHKRFLIESYRLKPPQYNKAHITGFPMYSDEFAAGQKGSFMREKIIVFPHRLDEEKNPSLFFEMEAYIKSNFAWAQEYKFIVSKLACQTKQDYYGLLRRAKFSVSFADQETWGIAMAESTLCGCIPIVPNRLSYAEMYPDEFKHSGSAKDAAMAINYLIETPHNLVYDTLKQVQNVLNHDGKRAFDNMFSVMEIA